MADPQGYNRTYSFTDFQAGNPSAPLPGVQVDNELENVEQSLEQVVNAIKDVRRSDGKLKNGIVTVDSLDPTVAAGVGSGALASAAAAAASANAAADSAEAAASSAGAASGYAGAAATSAGQAMTFRNEAETQKTLAQTARTGAQTARDFAAAWSSAAEGVDVDDGVNPVSKSSYHWAQVALGAATGALPDGSVTETKIVDGNVTRAKLATAVTDELDGKADAAATTASLALKQDTTGEYLRGHLHGLTLSNNTTDAANDIDVAAGSASSDGATPVLMTLASALTKRLDAAWTVGSGNGGLDTGSIANTTYHVWLIQRSDTGVVDVLFSTSATAPTMPANYDRKRRIGSILRESGAIVPFTQNGDDFTRAQVTDVSGTNGTATALLTLSVPTGIVVQPKFYTLLVLNQSTVAQIYVGNAFNGGANNLEIQNARTASGTTASDAVAMNGGIFTNTSGQIYHGRGVQSGSINQFRLSTTGWIDTRGRL